MKKAVIDRIEGNVAILVFSEENRQIDYPKAKLPAGAKEGTCLWVEMDEEKILGVKIDKKGEDETRLRIQGKLDMLRKRDTPQK